MVYTITGIHLDYFSEIIWSLLVIMKMQYIILHHIAIYIFIKL